MKLPQLKIFRFNKRQKFILSSLILTTGFLLIQFLDQAYKFIGIGFLGVSTILLFIWAIRDGLGVNMTLMSLVLPLYFTLGVGLFWFLLPANIYTQIPTLIFYGIGIYALFLTANIYTVAAIRNIALLRAARGVGFVMTLITSFLVFDTILSLRSPIYINSFLFFLFSFPLYLQGLWVIPLEHKPDKELFRYSLVFSIIIFEFSLLLYFWPVSVVVGSLFLTAAMYASLGLGQAHFEARLFPATVREYLLVGALVFMGMFVATRWGV